MADDHQKAGSVLSWTVDQGVIRELRNDGENFIFPWGVETADTVGFFSLEKEIGYRYIPEAAQFHEDDSTSETEMTVRMPEGHWTLRLEDRIERGGTAVHRTAGLTCRENTLLMDFVMRFRFRKQFFHSAEIAGRVIRHRDSDVYHQFPVRTVRLNGRDFGVTIEVLDAETGSRMTPMLYVRDHAGEWIVHARMVPAQCDKRVIKICNGWAGTRALPLWLSSPILSVPALRSFLWYRNERKPYPRLMRRLFNPNAFPMARLAAGDSLFWRVCVQVV